MAIQNFRVAGFVLGLGIKAPVHTAAIVNVTPLSGVGLNVNGWIVGAGDRVLLTAQTNPIDNGIYSVRTSAWIRDGDADGNRDFVGGTLVPVWNQSLTDIQLYRLEGNPDAKTIGVDSLVFSVYYDPSVLPNDAPSDGMTYGRNNAAWVIVAGGGEDLQATLLLGNLSNQSIQLEDAGATQLLTIAQTLNPATFTTTGAGIQFLGGSVEYFMDNALRVAGGPITAQQETFRSTNNLATAHMAMYHDNVDGVLEATDGSVDIRVDNGAVTQVRRLRAIVGATGGVALYAGAGDNQTFRNIEEGTADSIATAEAKDRGGTYRTLGFGVLPRVNVTGASNVGFLSWHRKLVSTAAANLTYASADQTTVPDDAVMWVIANVGAITLTEGAGMTIRKFLGGGASVTGNATIAEGGWATITKHSDSELWVTGLDVT